MNKSKNIKFHLSDHLLTYEMTKNKSVGSMLLPYDTSTINLTFEMNCQVQLNQIKIDIFCLIKYVFRSLQRSIVKHLLQIRGNWIHFNHIKS